MMAVDNDVGRAGYEKEGRRAESGKRVGCCKVRQSGLECEDEARSFAVHPSEGRLAALDEELAQWFEQLNAT